MALFLLKKNIEILTQSKNAKLQRYVPAAISTTDGIDNVSTKKYLSQYLDLYLRLNLLKILYDTIIVCTPCIVCS
jgi:hypothetical protein